MSTKKLKQHPDSGARKPTGGSRAWGDRAGSSDRAVRTREVNHSGSNIPRGCTPAMQRSPFATSANPGQAPDGLGQPEVAAQLISKSSGPPPAPSSSRSRPAPRSTFAIVPTPSSRARTQRPSRILPSSTRGTSCHPSSSVVDRAGLGLAGASPLMPMLPTRHSSMIPGNHGASGSILLEIRGSRFPVGWKPWSQATESSIHSSHPGRQRP
jgi:hypothetical protein